MFLAVATTILSGFLSCLARISTKLDRVAFQGCYLDLISLFPTYQLGCKGQAKASAGSGYEI